MTAPRRSSPEPSPALRAEDLAAELLDCVPAVMDALRGAMRRRAGDTMSVPQFRCLHFIHREPASSVGAVAAFLGVTLPTASAMVDRLVRAGAVLPSTAELDRRRSQLHITAAGRTQLQQIRRGAHSDLARTLAACSAADLKALHGGLAVLRRTFQPETTSP